MINVAIIDDRPQEVRVITQLLGGDSGISYQYFENPLDDQLIEWLRVQENPVVLLDLLFDGRELGEAAFARIRSVGRDIPIFIFSTAQDLATEDKYRALGCFDYIVKNRVTPESGKAFLQRITGAAESGNQFQKDIDAIRKNRESNPLLAILQLNALVSEKPNILAFQELHTWIKEYLRKGLGDMAIGVSFLLDMLADNCEKIEKLQGGAALELTFDKLWAFVHLGRNDEAEALMREARDRITDGKVHGARLIDFACALSAARTRKVRDASRIFDSLAVNPSMPIYDEVLTWCYHHDPTLWNEGVVQFLNYWKSTAKSKGAVRAERIVSLFGEGAGGSSILKADILVERPLDLIKFVYDCLSIVVSSQDVDQIDGDALFNCCQYVFGLNRDENLVVDNGSACKLLNALAGVFYLNDCPSDWITFIDDRISSIGTTDDSIIKEILERPHRSTDDKLRRFYSSLEYLMKMGESEKATMLIRHVEPLLMRAGDSDNVGAGSQERASQQWYKYGELFEKYLNPDGAATYFKRAIGGFLDEVERPDSGKKKTDALLYVQIAIKKLQERNIEINEYVERYRKLSSSNIRVPLPFDNMNVVIVGGHTDLKQRVKEFQSSLGGEFAFYAPDEKARLIKSIKFGGVDVVIYVSGYIGHLVWDTLIPAIDLYNNRGLKKIQKILLPEAIKNYSGIIAELKRQLEAEHS